MAEPSLHPAAPHALPGFLPGPDGSDPMLVFAGAMLLGTVIAFGLLFLRLHTLPERMAHRGQKLQFEIVAVLGLLALFTHVHLFWVVGLLLALIDIPDFAGPMRRIAGSAEKVAGLPPGEGDTLRDETGVPAHDHAAHAHPPPAHAPTPSHAAHAHHTPAPPRPAPAQHHPAPAHHYPAPAREAQGG